MTNKELKRLKEIEDRVKDVFRNDGDLIESGNFIRTTGEVFKENKWLCEQLRKALRAAKAEPVEEEEELVAADPTAAL